GGRPAPTRYRRFHHQPPKSPSLGPSQPSLRQAPREPGNGGPPAAPVPPPAGAIQDGRAAGGGEKVTGGGRQPARSQEGGAGRGAGDACGERPEPHRRELQVHCYRMLGSFQDAEDALQNTLLTAWQSLAGFEGRASIRTWLYKIATHRCLDARRAASRRPA